MSDFIPISCEKPPMREPRDYINREPLAGWEVACLIAIVACLAVLALSVVGG